jgi:hypothetical protein
MFERVLTIAVIGAAALTSVGVSASDRGTSNSWSASSPGNWYAPPPTVRYVHNGPPVRYVAPRHYPSHRWAPPYAHRWAPSHGYYRHGYHSGYRYWNGHGPNRWSGHDDHRDNRHDDHDNRHDDHDDHDDWRGR